MAAQVFPDPEAGKRYNGQFINYKIDAEKGEGIALAQKYNVDGFPTNLYIDPETENVVYRVMGATDVPHFLERADIAVLEQKDPMKWNDYARKFDGGNRDKDFLVAYLAKAERLDQPNDRMLDAYVEKYVTAAPTDSTLDFLLNNTRTLNNKSVAVLYSNRSRIDKLHTDPEHYMEQWMSQLPYATLQAAIAGKDERLLSRIGDDMKKYGIHSSMPGDIYFYRKEYFTRTGNDEKAWKAAAEEADYLAGLPQSKYDAMNKEAMPNIRASLLYQLKGLNVPEEKHESSIETTLKKHPEMLKTASISAGNSLNETAWKVFEQKRDDKKMVEKALVWSGKAQDMAQGTDSWAPFADTHANLLYAKGQKSEAIASEEAVVKKVKENQWEGLENYEETLQKMKAGNL